MMVKTCNKNVHPGHPNLRAWDNYPEHCHSWDQVIIVMIMTGNDHFPLLHSSRSKLFFIVSNILTFLHWVKYFQIYATWPYSRGHVRNPAVYGISQLPMIINYDQISSIMTATKLCTMIITYDGKLWTMMVLRFTRTRSRRLIFLQTSQPSQTPLAGKNTNQTSMAGNTIQKFTNPCLRHLIFFRH